ncbi:uncharacterized protein CANTADRAFT_25878 [Suhomyces tanzawaensis NRRL Y-17324]|uniref:Protein SCD5 n=1 Tax=Suhomyces tanzawaensis NRRL Y-17324 TaxID=984487 RepID=A0A1E4SL33_9ASCO|nr:uncharacterized protein CANTADRAFT_25878 [Suhomyces tanzawaensis NRRL Y-17324]ODV80198.1 hypothetical protein CANTADRAFT_25878 [Suhomyces tanzawaensis NRRL Y-17324]
MDAPGYDWLNIPSNRSDNGDGHNFRAQAFGQPASGASSPIPPVSFGLGSTGQNGSGSGVANGPGSSGHNPGFNQPPEITVQRTEAGTHQPHNYYFRNNSADQLRANARQNNETFGQSSSMDSLFQDQSNTEDDYSIPLSLTAQELTLQESKTYMRWYSDILARTNSRTVTMHDVFTFLNNFKIPTTAKEKIQRIFQKLLRSINIGEFFALLRLISHTLNGSDPMRKLIKVKALVPTPPSILSKKRQNDEDNEPEADFDDTGIVENIPPPSQNHTNKPLDLDTFTQFMLTGERPDDVPKKKRSKKLKSVKFSDQIVTDIHDSSFINSPVGSPMPDSKLDYSLPMDQLLNKIKQQPTQQQFKPDEEERKVLEEMEPQMNHFRNLHAVDTASIGGVPANLEVHDNYEFLRPNMTGPAQMAEMFSPSPEPELLKPNMTGPAQMQKYYNSDPSLRDDVAPLRPNATGPLDMARIFSPSAPSEVQPQQQLHQDAAKVSLQSFTSQMTGNTFANTVQNSRVSSDGSPVRHHSSSLSNRPLPPPPVPNTRRTRSVSSPTPRHSSPLSNQYNSAENLQNNSSTLAVPGQPPMIPPRSPLSNNYMNTSQSHSGSPVPNNVGKIPPPPPPSRRRNTSVSALGNLPAQGNAPALPPKVVIGQQLYYQPSSNNPYSNGDTAPNNIYSGGNQSNDSTANILDDLKALQEEVDKIRDMTGGF